ncbi:hypothetical protein [Paenibacillus graminis]|uniref:Uncharacterized protein n=1 Tax=Paenibacillus graminis TaxID=189425 RepID=A0A089MDT3_9BACL|nr:hypothetical protein [Paenibacillus graminis]AIQ69648.1 hypothetical protein PGRAT_19965 [Paenibacillus graminis]
MSTPRPETTLRVFATNPSFIGIKGSIKIPTTLNVSGGYVDWYFGLGNAIVEAGISYTGTKFRTPIKITSAGGEPIIGTSQDDITGITPGATVPIQLLHDRPNHTISVWINGVKIWNSISILDSHGNDVLGSASTAKMVFGLDDQGASSYSQGSFTLLKLQKTDGTWIDWNSNVPYTPLPSGSASSFNLSSYVPLSASLNAN